MKKIIIKCLVVAFISCGSSFANLSWIYTGNLLTFDAAIQNGWLVQMYEDVNTNSVLSSISSFDLSGTPTGTNVSDDQLLTSLTASIITNGKNPLAKEWGVSVSPAVWGGLFNQSVYSVIYNASTIGAATEAVVVDASVKLLAGADPATYSLSSVNNSWVAVPEPATFLLFAMGGFGAWLIRRKNMKIKEEV